MPKDSFRSMVYRSFVTCDDPDGIVECKTIRRSKAAKKLGTKVKNAISEKNLVTSSQKGMRKEASSKSSIDKLDGSCSVQLKEVSKGGRKLIEAVDSVSKNSVERKSEDIAKELLKGAVSLQESLKMLGKLQEVSKYMTGFKKDKSGDGKSLLRSYSSRFADHGNGIEFQNRRLSADIGSSKDCYDELREVITESFARQNLLQKGSSEGKEFADRKLESSVDTASASSSQSSMFNSHDFISSDSSSSNVQSERPKGSNCVAKLMGLDELTSKPVQFSNSTNRIPILDLDFPIARNPSFVVHKAKPDQRTLKGIIEIMQSKGLMRGKSSDKPAQKSHPYEVSNDSPPIVLLKPLHNSRVGTEYNCTCGRTSPDNKVMLKKPMMREGVSSKSVDPREALNNATMQRKDNADKHAESGIGREKVAKSFRETGTRSKDKQSERHDNGPPIRPRTSSHVTHHLQKGEVIEKRVDKIHRVAPEMKNGDKKNQLKVLNSESFSVSCADHKGNIDSKLRSSRESIASNNQLPQQKSTISRSRRAKTVPSSAKQKKPIKTAKLSNNQIPVAVESIENSIVDIEINPESENKDGMMETRMSLELMSSKEGRNVPVFCSRDDTYSSSESTAVTVQQNLGSMGSEVNCILSENERKKSQSTVRDVLSSSTTLLNHAEELFDITTDQSVLLEATTLDDDELPDAKVIIDCATELLKCRCQQWELTVYPVLQHPKKWPKISVSYDHLVGRICDEIGKLKDNSRLGGGDLVIDDFYVKLKRDLWCNGAVSGAWDLGWMNVFTWDEVHQVGVDIEEHLLGVIVEDLLSDILH